MPLTFERRKTSKNLLKIAWDYPASLDIQPPTDGRTTASTRMYALSRDDALAKIRGDDPRPLLVVRECGRCKGTDDALLSRNLDNERTLVASRWFRCVKLKENVMDANHTFRQLFAAEKPAHLFFASTAGVLIPLPGNQTQGELWQAMLATLRDEYDADPEQATKDILQLYSTYDAIDGMEDQIAEQIDAEVEARGPKSPKVKKLRAKLDELADRKAAARAKEAKLSELGPKKPPKVG